MRILTPWAANSLRPNRESSVVDDVRQMGKYYPLIDCAGPLLICCSHPCTDRHDTTCVLSAVREWLSTRSVHEVAWQFVSYLNRSLCLAGGMG